MGVLGLLLRVYLASVGVAFSATAQQATEDAPVRIQVRGPEAPLWPGQWGELALRIEVDAEFREQSMLQLFRRSLDMPLDLQTSEWTALPNLEWQALSEVDQSGGQSMAWDGQQVALNWTLEQTGERQFWVAEVQRAVRARQAGAFNLPAARLRYATASRFEVDILGERVPVDEQRLEAVSAPVKLEVRAFPIAAQPSSFTGAIGEWLIEAEEQPLATNEQGDLRLIYRLRPTNEHAHAQQNVLPSDWRPQVELGDDWQVLGILQLPAPPGEARLQMDLRARRSGALWSPTWSVVSFLTDRAAYVQVELPRWKVQATGIATLDKRVQDSQSYSPARPAKQLGGVPAGFGLGIAVGALLLALGASLHQRMRQRLLRKDAREDLDRSRPTNDCAEREFLAWLAQSLGWPQARLIQPQLADELIAHGIPEQLAGHTADWLREVEAARYGGPPLVDAPARLQALREAWSRHTF